MLLPDLFLLPPKHCAWSEPHSGVKFTACKRRLRKVRLVIHKENILQRISPASVPPIWSNLQCCDCYDDVMKVAIVYPTRIMKGRFSLSRPKQD